MKESSTYQAILREGRVEEARHLLLRLGEAKFGLPDELTLSVINRTSELEPLEEAVVQLLSADSWFDLWKTPQPQRPRTRRRSGS